MQNRKISNESIERDNIHRNIIYDDETKNINDQDTSNEEDIEEAGGVIYNRYYHLSSIKGLTKLQPSVPNNFLTDYGFENNAIKRVCFTPSIDQCLMAMSANITHKEFYVYIPYNIDTNKLRKPSVEEVPDSLITGEVWSLQSVRIKCIGKIRVIKAKGTTHKYNYGNKYTAELYEWEYEWVEKYLIDESTELELPEYDGLAGTLTTNDDIELELPNPEKADLPDLKTLLDNTDPKHIWLSSDWHFFKNHYKKEVNFVNTRDITQWCYNNLKDDDVFMYLGDISFRYANEEDQLKSQEILKKIPAGKKILVLGNHDKMLGEDYFTGCGFDYVVEDIYWQNYLFTHKPVRMDTYPEDVINIHGHMHTNRDYNTSDGTRNVNIYPKFFDNKPVTLDYVSKHWKELSKDNYWNPNYGYGEAVHNITNSTVLKLVQEANSTTQKPTVYFSNTVDSKTIAYMVSLFKNNVGSNTAIKIDFNNNALNSKLLKDLTKATNSAFVNSNYIKQITNASDHITAANTLGYDYGHIDILDNDGDIRLSIPQRYQIENELRELNNGKPEYESYVSRGIHLQDISVGSHIKNYDSLIVYTNFAIDKVSGYSGAIKNIGYGVASGKVGKLQIHGQNMQSGPILLERIVESAAAINSLFNDRTIYINVLQSMGSNIPNIGVLVSNDIVAIEQASIDFIRNAPKNKTFIEHIGARGGFHQIEYANWLRMGSKNYILRDLSNNRIKLENTVFNENLLFNRRDVEYRVDEFKNGDLNIALVVGFSGSGKSTLGRNLAKAIPNTDHYELDDLVCNWNFTDDNLKEYGDLIYSFFQGPGKKFRISYDDLVNMHIEEKDYEIPLVEAFLKYAYTYSKSHKNRKNVIEGVWPLIHGHSPDTFKDWCVIIKGTSYLNSEIRATKRDVDNGKGLPYFKALVSNFLANNNPDRLKTIMKPMNANINIWYKYFKTPINEATTKRSELPDSAFGIPEDRKYPLDTEKHVRSAIKLFGHAEESKKKSLARRIKAAAKKYDITIPETTQCYKYLNEAVQEIVPDEIQTIVFDFGHVLVHTDLKAQLLANQDIPNELVEPIRDFVHTNFFYNEEDRNNLQMLDIPQAKQRYMQLASDDIKPYVDAVFDAMRYNCNYYSYSKSLIALFRSRGCKLYYLSNWDRYAYDLQINFFNDITNLFDGGIMSFQVNDRKPNDSIYHTLINKYNIDPARTMFFDDRRENIEAANRCGFNTYLFNNEETPKILLSNNYIKKSNLEDMNNYILLQDGDRLVNLPMSIVTYWYINENEHPEDVDSGAYYSTLDECVNNKINEVNNNSGFKDNLYLTEYVFTSNLALDKENQSTEDHKLVMIGEINIFESGAYEWTIQMPLKLVGKELYPLKEYTSIAAMNPVIGINKPFVVNTGEKKIGFMTDIESDKMLVTDDDNTLEVVPTNEYTITDIYEFIGNEAYVDRLNKLYKNSSKVDNIYSILTGRELYTEDQLDFDTSFRKIDLDLIEQKMLSEFATLRDNIIDACGINTDIVRPVIEPLGKSTPSFVNKYNTLGDISIKEDFDGIYFYSDLTHKRSASVASINLLTENMLKVIM